MGSWSFISAAPAALPIPPGARFQQSIIGTRPEVEDRTFSSPMAYGPLSGVPAAAIPTALKLLRLILVQLSITSSSSDYYSRL
jgi:hypothetical protein